MAMLARHVASVSEVYLQDIDIQGLERPCFNGCEFVDEFRVAHVIYEKVSKQ
jgi:hypothetical protein